jgi:hypothetical protein
MTVKDLHYYRAFDLVGASKEIQQLGSDRGSHEIFGDAIQSLLIIATEREVPSCEIEQVLGKPDRIKSKEKGEVWEYDWADVYGSANYTSSTPFQVLNGVCVGLAAEDD